jgi:hypothetical protein
LGMSGCGFSMLRDRRSPPCPRRGRASRRALDDRRSPRSDGSANLSRQLAIVRDPIEGSGSVSRTAPHHRDGPGAGRSPRGWCGALAAGLELFGIDRQRGAHGDRRGHDRADRFRGDDRRARRAAGHRHVVAAVYAAVVPRPAAEGGTRDVRGHVYVRVLAAAARRGRLRARHRRHHSRGRPSRPASDCC